MSGAEPSLNSLHQQLILEHYRTPRNRGELEAADATVRKLNPSCGDQITLYLRLEGDAISEVKFTGQGCSISLASVSMLSDLLLGKSATAAEIIAEKFTAMMRGDESVSQDPGMGDLRALAGVSRFPQRVKCALLGFDALNEALEQVGGSATEE